jgi:hypothetical protein
MSSPIDSNPEWWKFEPIMTSRSSHRDQQPDVAPIAMADQVRRTIQILKYTDCLIGHRVVVERLCCVGCTPMTAPIECRDAVALAQRRADRT